MADGIEFKMITEPFTAGIADRQKRMPRAAMWAVREAGRAVKITAKAKAPVLADKSVTSASAYRRAYKQRKKRRARTHRRRGGQSAGTAPCPVGSRVPER